MPYRRLPNSTPAVLRTLIKARDFYANTPAGGDFAIGADIFAQLDATVPTNLLNRWMKELGEIDHAQALQSPLTSATSQAAAKLTMIVSHFHQVFDFAVTRGDYAAGDRAYFGRPVGGDTLPPMSSYAELEAAAQAIVDGETDRSDAQGIEYVAMSNPSAAQVGAALTDFREVHDASEQAQVRTNREQEEAMALYPEVHALAVDICETVEFHYRKDPLASSRRAKSRPWGVVYIYGENEPRDPDDPAPEEGTEPTPPPGTAPA